MADITKLGRLTVIAAADIASAAHAINTEQSTQYNDQAGVGKVVGEIYLRDNGANAYDFAIPLEAGATGKWRIIGTVSAVITPA